MTPGPFNLDLSLGVWARLALAQEFGLVSGPVGLLSLSVLFDAGPAPHVMAAPDVDLQDAVEAVPPPERHRKQTHP